MMVHLRSSKWWVVAVLVLSLLLSMTLPAVHAKTDNTTSTTSEECATETSTINSDPTLQQALVDLKTNISAILQEDFYQFCSILDGGCTVNLTTYYPETLPSACTDAGGQLAKQKARLHCTGKVLGIPIPGGVRVEFVDIPACVGLSCNLSSGGGVPTIVEDAIEQVLEEVGQVVEMGLDDGNCTAAIGASSAAAAAIVGSARQSWIVSTALAVLVGLLTGTV